MNHHYLGQPRSLHVRQEQDVAHDQERQEAEDGKRVEHPRVVVIGVRPDLRVLLVDVGGKGGGRALAAKGRSGVESCVVELRVVAVCCRAAS